MSYITVDSSTSSTTVLVFDEKLEILKKFQKEHSQIVTQEGYIEHDLEEIYQNLLDDLKSSYKSVGKINIITKRIDNLNLSKLRGSLDSLKKEVSNLIIILVGSMEEKSTILVSVSNDITATYDARNLLDSLSKIIGAKGGGKSDFAQAGGPASNKLDEILISAEKILTEI